MRCGSDIRCSRVSVAKAAKIKAIAKQGAVPHRALATARALETNARRQRDRHDARYVHRKPSSNRQMQ